MRDKVDANSRFYTPTFLVFTMLLFSRVLSMCLIPLNDYSEARYGEIARKMLETGNWVTLQHDYGVPFWAKPPLSTWLSAFSMKCFGVNELAVRLPGLLLSIGVLCLVWSLVRNQRSALQAWFSTLVLAATLYFFLDAGTVMTDPALVFCTTLTLVSFWRAVVLGQKIWSYLFFVSLGLGLLAKGPIAMVLVGLPLFFWVLWRNEWLAFWKRLPWWIGILITLALALPWYWIAEQRTPGFLNYFIVGEHVQRFLHPGWVGDKYGHAHDEPLGMIWVYALGGIFPWNMLGLAWLIRYGKRIPAFFGDEKGWMSYLFLWVTLPLLFFTFASNIIYTYVFPVLPAFALLFTEFWFRSNPPASWMKWIMISASLTSLLFLVGTAIFVWKPEIVAKTQKPIVHAWLDQRPESHSKLLFWGYVADYSAQFYSSGKVASTRDLERLCTFFSKQEQNYLVIDSTELAEIPVNVLNQLSEIYTQKYKGTQRVLLRGSGLIC